MTKEERLERFKIEHPGYFEYKSKYIKNQEQAKNSFSLWKKKYPEKRLAHSKVFIATRNGTLKKLPCKFCGEIKSEAHHENYSKPLDVVWLCRKHHMIADTKRRLKEKLLTKQ